MTQGLEKKTSSKGNVENVNNRRNRNIAIDPTLLGILDNTVTEPPHPRTSRRAPSTLPRSRRDHRRVNEHLPSVLDDDQGYNYDVPQPSQQSYYQTSLEYPDAGLIDYGGLGSESLSALGSRAVPEAQPETGLPAPQRTNEHSRVQRSAEDSFFADVEDMIKDASLESRSSTRQSKRIRASRKYESNGTEVDGRTRKVSKLQTKIMEGKAPKKGLLGPMGEVRTRADGRMEFRDAENPEWTLAAYHSQYRRLFLDEAAERGEFVYEPTRGEAADDETSYEPEQQTWGPSKEDWHHITNSEGRKVMFDLDKPASRRPSEEPGNWVHDGVVLLDSKNHAVKDWPGLNKTLSTEIESWRWEALMRVYPWLTVADLLARMPHTREKKGAILPLQTPAAFTNRAYRFRIPNQIPASNPKNGSHAYKEEILKNLAKENPDNTEDLPVLNLDQVQKVKRTNKGKFTQNSRYVAKKAEDSTQAPPPSRKRKAYCDDDVGDAEPKPEQVGSEAKRPRTRPPANLREEVPNLNNLDWRPIHDPNIIPETYSDDASFYNGLSNTAGPPNHQRQSDLVPLFATTDDRSFALVEDADFANADAVMQARRNGDRLTRQIEVYYYNRSTPRFTDWDGTTLDDVAHFDFRGTYTAVEPIPGDTQRAPQSASTDYVAPPVVQSNHPPVSVPWSDEPGAGSYHDFPPQAPTAYPAATVFPTLQAPLAFPNPIARYQTPSDVYGEVWREHYGSAGF